jgi:predicted TIM-barrel fold metal-dependent hydrolase
MNAVNRRQSHDYRVIDGHVHIGGPPERHGAPDEVLKLLESINAERAVCLPAPGLEPDNAELERLVTPYRGRLYPCVWVNPVAGRRAADTVDEYAKRGWRVLKLQPAMHQFSLVDASTLAVVETGLRHALTMIIHTGGSPKASPWMVGELAMRYPEARIIVDHMGGADMDYVNAAITVAERHPNLFLGTSQMLFYRKYAEAAQRVTASRLVFGSDAPVIHPLPEFERVRAAGLPRDGEAKIFGDNVARLLGV